MNGSDVCDKVSGQCPCKELLTGRTCNQCQVGTLNFLILMTGPALLRVAMFPVLALYNPTKP